MATQSALRGGRVMDGRRIIGEGGCTENERDPLVANGIRDAFLGRLRLTESKTGNDALKGDAGRGLRLTGSA